MKALPIPRPRPSTPPSPSSSSLPPSQHSILSQTNPNSPHTQNNSPPRPPKRPSGVRVTTSALLSVLRDAQRENWSSPSPSDMAAILASGGSLKVTDTKEEVEEVARRMVEPASSLERGIDVASWILRVTEEGRREEGVIILVYRTVQELAELLKRVRPRPHPEPLIEILLSNQARIRHAFYGSVHKPLLFLLEIYSRLYTQDRRRLDPVGTDPTPQVLVELESLRLQHLAAVRAIHQAMKEVDKDVFTVRSCTSLMEAYDKGGSFEDVEEVWKLMRSEGGVGIDQRAVSVYFDACGFSGSLPRALETWKDLRASGFDLDENNHQAYQECLNRCGAWDELLLFLSEQQAQHLVDSAPTPPLTAPGLASMIKLATRLVMYPRHRTLRAVDQEQSNQFRRRVEEIVPKETWKEVERILQKKGRHTVDSGPKIGNGRRPDRQRLL